MKEQTIQLYDLSNMRKLLSDFHLQVMDAVKIGEKAKINLKKSLIKNIVISGLGGSAIGGDLIRSYLYSEIKVPITINRHYYLPNFVDKDCLVIISSYSGNTEETISSFKDALKKGAKIICVTSGGEIEKLANRNKINVIKIPTGYPPRAALGYAFFPLLILLSKLGFIKSKKNDIDETIKLLKKKSKIFSSLNPEKNLALNYAQDLYGKLPIIYSSVTMDSVNLRFRGQFSENSKVLAFGNIVPEMNHNELVGWKVLKRDMENMAVIFLRDKDDYKRIRVRMDIMQGIVNEYASQITNIQSEGNSLLARTFSLIYLGDWISFYLAVINGIDPTPVRIIDYLKSELSKVK